MGMYLAEAVAPGGPSAPAWAFFTAISIALIGILSQQVSAKRVAKSTKEKTEQAVRNTESVSNGFVRRIDGKLDRLAETQQEIIRWQRDHEKVHNTERYYQ